MNSEMEDGISMPQRPPINILPPTPAGLESLYSLCRRIYPNQVNPLQVTALLKYWLGGPDPLDYISMYANPGIPSENIPAHWHYISFGLSDLHGDGRVHDINGPEGISGFGFELTFRLKREPEETAPPTWPATLMQSLAKYVFQSGNTLCPGDHVSWHCALDNSESRIQHMLMTSDVQLKSTQTPYGSVDFVQIVGICMEELKAAQQWNGAGMLDMLSKIPTAGGVWHITDMRRGESIFELDPNSQEKIERGFELEGSNLSGVSARCCWTELSENCNNYSAQNPMSRSQIISQEISELNRKFSMHNPEISSSPPNSNFTNSQHQFLTGNSQLLGQNSSSTSGGHIRNYDSNMAASSAETNELQMLNVRKLEGVHLIFDLESGSLLPLAIRGRVKHGRHFTFKSIIQEDCSAGAITLVAPTVTGTLVTAESPYAVAKNTWLQILITEDLAQDMATKFQILAKNPERLSLPKTFAWPDRKLSITIVADKLL